MAEKENAEKTNWETIWMRKHKKNNLYLKKVGQRIAIGIGSSENVRYVILEREEAAYLAFLLETILKETMLEGRA